MVYQEAAPSGFGLGHYTLRRFPLVFGHGCLVYQEAAPSGVWPWSSLSIAADCSPGSWKDWLPLAP